MSGFVYFIAAETVGAVKIGFSKRHPRGRLRELQTGCPTPLKLVAFIEGGLEHEMGLHRQFTDLRIHSEWFRFEGPLAEMVSALPPPAEPAPDGLVKCPICRTRADIGRDHLAGLSSIKICRGLQFEEVVE